MVQLRCFRVGFSAGRGFVFARYLLVCVFHRYRSLGVFRDTVGCLPDSILCRTAHFRVRCELTMNSQTGESVHLRLQLNTGQKML